MADIFKEYLIKQKKSPVDLLAQAGIVLVTAIIVFIGFLPNLPFLGPILILVALFSAAVLFTKFNREYEYILTNNELDIDVIYSKSRRKRVLTIDMKNIVIMASIQDGAKSQELQKGNKVINASDGENGPNTYAIVTSKDNVLYKVLITPNEAFLNELYRQAPHKVFKRV